MGTTRRIASVEGARGLAALSVLAFHVLQSRGTTSLQPVTSRLWLGVPLFFVISGFVLFRPFARAIVSGGEWPSLRRYARSRMLRIFPALWVMTGVSLWVLTPSMRAGVLVVAAGLALAMVAVRPPRGRAGQAFAVVVVPALAVLATFQAAVSDSTALRQAIEQFSLLQLYTLDTPDVTIGPVWTLCVESGFYLLLPVVCFAMLRTVRTAKTGAPVVLGGSLLVLAAVGLVYNWFMGWGSGLPTTAVGFLPQFAAGMWLALAAECRWFHRRAAPLAVGALGLAALAIAVQTVGPANNTEGSGPLFGATIAAAFALALATVVVPDRSNWLARGLSVKPVVWLGTISYGVYLWHYPVVMWTREHGREWSAAHDLAVTLVATLGVAALSWLVVERPALGMRERSLLGDGGRADRRGAPAPVRSG